MTKEEAIKVAYGIPVTKAQHEALQFLIPELRESEDERIRRTLVEYFGPQAQLDFVRGIPIQKIRDWLEKQKEQKQTDLPAGFYYIDLNGNRYYSKEFRYGDMKLKVGEQKPNQSEEESFLSTIESEKPIEELEKEMDKFFETMPVLEHENIFEDTFKNIARHFAEWGAEHAKIESENPVPTDLEEAAEEYSQKVSDGRNYRDLRVGFIAGYKYHADHTPLPEDTVIYQKGVTEGKRLMMEEAVEGLFQNTPFPTICLDDCKDYNFKVGDKVRAIVLPKEDDR